MIVCFLLSNLMTWMAFSGTPCVTQHNTLKFKVQHFFKQFLSKKVYDSHHFFLIKTLIFLI